MLAQPPKRDPAPVAGSPTQSAGGIAPAPALQLATGFAPRWPGLDGLHERLPYARYHEDPALRHSVLNRISVSPAFLKLSLELGGDDSTAKTQGRVFHLLALEPELAEHQVVRVNVGSRNANLYKSAVETNPGKDVILLHEWEELGRLAELLRAKGIWNDLVRGAKIEASLFWAMRTGLRLKARPDILRLSDGVVADLKTTRDLRYFKRDAEEYGYYRQLALQSDGVEALSARRPDLHLLIAVCKRTRDFKIFEVGRKTMETAHRENRRNLALYDECARTDVWPGFPQRVEVLAP